MDNSVEIVEKSWFSTGISWFWELHGMQKLPILSWLNPEKIHNSYVTLPEHTGYLKGENTAKSSAFVQLTLFLAYSPKDAEGIFVNYRQTPPMYV